MTKRELKRIADTVRRMKLTNLARITVAEDLADDFEKHNPEFNREAFLDWAGIYGGKK